MQNCWRAPDIANRRLNAGVRGVTVNFGNLRRHFSRPAYTSRNLALGLHAVNRLARARTSAPISVEFSNQRLCVALICARSSWHWRRSSLSAIATILGTAACGHPHRSTSRSKQDSTCPRGRFRRGLASPQRKWPSGTRHGLSEFAELPYERIGYHRFGSHIFESHVKILFGRQEQRPPGFPGGLLSVADVWI